MFTYALHGLRFCSEDADASFADRIGGDKYSDDETFIAVLRALLAPRFGEDTSKSVKVVQNTVVCGSSEDDAAAMSLIERVRMDNSTITIVAMRGLTADARRKMCERIRHLFPEEFPGYQSIETVDQFFAQNKLYISGFINETAQTSVRFEHEHDAVSYDSGVFAEIYPVALQGIAAHAGRESAFAQTCIGQRARRIRQRDRQARGRV